MGTQEGDEIVYIVMKPLPSGRALVIGSCCGYTTVVNSSRTPKLYVKRKAWSFNMSKRRRDKKMS